MKRKLILRLILTVGLILVGFLGVGESFGRETASFTRTHSGGGVRVKVTYLNPQDTDGSRFEVSLDTHSVNLDAYDLKALSLLRDDGGKVYKAGRVENRGGGHHRKTVLYFPTIPVGVQTVELIIKDIAGIQERSFRWELSR